MTDPIADMLSRIRNATTVRKERVVMPTSRLKEEIARVLKEEGYIQDYAVSEGPMKELSVLLRYTPSRIPVIHTIKRVSKPGGRMYVDRASIPVVQQNMGIAILSTSRGVMSNHAAREKGVGGEVLCYVS
ncbi:MAG: 30S ribosomal protein S8 [Patescibacteria group bacterium]